MRLILAALMAAALATPALAGPAVTLKSDTSASGPVTLGDLFEGAGLAGKVVVGPAVKPGASLVLDAETVQQAAARAGLVWSNERGVRRIVVHGGEASASETASGGPSAEHPSGPVQVLAYARNLETGEIVHAEDLTWAKAVAAPAAAPRDADQIIGKQARRPLREGGLVSTRDVASATVIKRDDMVSVTYADGGVSVSMEGKATGNAAVGDAIGVINPSTKKVIQAVASGPDQAVIGPAAARLRADGSGAASQFASR